MLERPQLADLHSIELLQHIHSALQDVEYIPHDSIIRNEPYMSGDRTTTFELFYYRPRDVNYFASDQGTNLICNPLTSILK